ncbi:hypothetical protein JCM3774_006762 [Rhodotorula dairenensis]
MLAQPRSATPVSPPATVECTVEPRPLEANSTSTASSRTPAPLHGAPGPASSSAMTLETQDGSTQAGANGAVRVGQASPSFDKSPTTVSPPLIGPLPASAALRDGSCDLPVNPLFGLGEQIRVRDLDRSRLLVQKSAIVSRNGDTTRSASAVPRTRTKGVSKERPRRPDDHDEHWHDRILAKAYEWGLAGTTANGSSGRGVGGDDEERGRTLYLPVPSVGLDSGQRGDSLAVPNGNQEGYASQVEGFREQEEKQDHYDAARIKLRSLHSEVHEILENVGFRSPVSEGRPDVSTPQLDRPEGDRPPSPTASSVQHQSSFYSAVSEVVPSDTGHTSFDVPDLSVIPPRTDSPLSFASLTDAAPSTPTATYPPRDYPGGATAPLSARVVDTPHFPVPSSSHQPPTNDRRASQSSAGTSEQDLLPSFVVSENTSANGRSLPPRRGSRASYAAPPVSSGEPYLGAPAQIVGAVAPPSPLRSSGGSRRSTTGGASALLTTPPIGNGTETAGSSPATITSRRFSSASASPGRLAVPTMAPRSQSFSPGAPILPAAEGSPEAAGDQSYPASGASPTTSMSYPPVGTTTQPMLLDDVELSIAAQAEVIRRQRQEKRLEAEKEQAKRERELQLERDRAAGGGGKKERMPSDGSNSAPIEDKLPSGPGGLLRRRVTRMGSGSSQHDGSPSAHGREASGATARDESAGRRARGGSGREDHHHHHHHHHPAVGVLVGNLIGQDHANYVLMYNMLTGIRIGVSRCQAKAKRPLTDADYTARHKFSFDIVGNELTPSVKYDFKFKDYAPWVFRELREYFYLDPSDYLVSLTAKYILSELGSPGKSGSFFYFSRDYRFIIKTIRHSEHKFLRSILKDYHEHVKKNPHTLLSRFYGLHRVKLPRGKKIHFVIMNNLFPPHRDIHETYDLKGSAIGRLYPEDKAKQNPHATLKDLNWVQRQRQFWLGPEKKVLFEEQLRRDTELLQRLGIMDYSLLTGIHNLFKGNSEGLREEKLSVFQPDAVKVSRKATQIKRDADASALRKAVQRSDPQALGGKHELPQTDSSERRLFIFYQDEGGMRASGDNNEDLGVIYYLGIIDILTPFTFVKRLEHFFKGMKHNKHMISAVPPREYGNRFLAFIKGSIRGNDPSLRPPMYEHEKKKCWGDQPTVTSEPLPPEKPAGAQHEPKIKAQ